MTFGLRLIQIDQPIVENYVGRQIPTAMVARNLDRGSGFGHPELDVAPFPNLFLVEPPVYEVVVVGLRQLTGLSIERAGRVVSAFGITLAAWGLFGLAARRRGERQALATIAAFAIFPVTIRYGRAFQPDALMLGAILAGLRLWDNYAFQPRWRTLAAAWFLTALGFALKITSGFVLVPLILVILETQRWKLKALATCCLLPAIAWYLYAAWLLSGKEVASAASVENGRIWMQVLMPLALFKATTYVYIGRFFLVRAFTPIAPPLALLGFISRASCFETLSTLESRSGRFTRLRFVLVSAAGRCLKYKHEAQASESQRCLGDGRAQYTDGTPSDRLWRCWGLAAMATLAVLSAKLHHEYYFLILAPVVAVGMVSALAWIERQGQSSLISTTRPQSLVPTVLRGNAVFHALRGLLGTRPRNGRGASGTAFPRGAWERDKSGRLATFLLAFGFTIGCYLCSTSTWVTPSEWSGIIQAGSEIRERTSEDNWIVAPEALIYYSDRKGCRLEYTSASAKRAAGEWGVDAKVEQPIELVAFYRSRGAAYFADLAFDGEPSDRLALHNAVRRRYKIVIDRPGLLLARLTDLEP